VTTYLLDINLLIALSDSMHIHHEAAHQWFGAKGQNAWATCPITENGFLRIASHPKYPNRPGDIAAVLSILRQFCESSGHQFWAEDISILDIISTDTVLTHAQLTDIYLAGLAHHNQGKLATLDRHIPLSVVPGGANTLEVIPAE
jgi:toxin-antitoxin system PIN domain toxin